MEVGYQTSTVFQQKRQQKH